MIITRNKRSCGCFDLGRKSIARRAVIAADLDINSCGEKVAALIGAPLVLRSEAAKAGHTRDLRRVPTMSAPLLNPADAEVSSEARIRTIEVNVSPVVAAWVRGMAEKIDPRGQRDAAIRAAAGLLAPAPISATAKQMEAELRRYLVNGWRRGDRDLSSEPPGASEMRRMLWRIARLTDGDGLGWRRILEIIET